MNVMQDLGGLERVRGAARVALRPGGRLGDLYQQGSAKAILPRVSGAPEVVFLNTAGGLTGGDRLSYRLDLGAGLRATATTQTAERAYRAGQGRARMDVGFTVGPGGWLDWLPQETILFEGAALVRRTEIRLDPGAKGCLALETLVLGRAAMGETVTRLDLTDDRRVWRGDRLVHADPVRLTDDALRPQAAGLGEARAVASLVLLAQGAEDAVEPLARVLDEPGTRAAASALPGRLVLRALAVDSWPLRRLMARALTLLRPGPLPRVWQM